MSKLADECSETKMGKVCFLTNIAGKDSKGGVIVLLEEEVWYPTGESDQRKHNA